MRSGGDRLQHRDPRGGDPQTGRAQLRRGVGVVGVHVSDTPPFLELVKKRCSSSVAQITFDRMEYIRVDGR
ncbi:hypothetical protein GCM10009764_24150 [Nocardia ninae]